MARAWRWGGSLYNLPVNPRSASGPAADQLLQGKADTPGEGDSAHRAPTSPEMRH